MSNGQELKISRMYKKAKNKRLFARENYKLREFVLTASSLKYFDICGGSRGKLKGLINLVSIKYVEKVQDDELDNKCNVLQVGYVDDNITGMMYIVSNCDEEREDWLQLLHHYAREEGAVLQPRYHPGVWTRAKGRYSCCGDECRVSMGCALVDRIPMESRVRECESVVALHEFEACQERQLSLVKGARYSVIDDANRDWWYLRDESGVVGYAPRNYVQPTDDLTSHAWFYGDVSRQEAESVLMREGREGCFMVRCSSSGLTLSVAARRDGHATVRVHHYRIRQSSDTGPYFVAEKYVRATLAELIDCHRHNSGGLVVRLRNAPGHAAGTDLEPGLGEFEVDASELSLDDGTIGRGQFGLVRRGMFRGMPVAVKQMLDGAMNEDDFVEEAVNMRCLNHPNLVRLFAVVLRSRPIMIVTEYMRHGSLREFLRNNYADYWSNTAILSDACAQISNGMAYLEQRNFVHRDLAARNVLVNSVDRRCLQVKVADFGMTRFLVDNVYEPSAGTKFPVRWAAPEVFQSVYTPRADVWSYGVLVWEVFTSGLQVPYLGQSNGQVYQFIMGGGRLAKPHGCPDRVYVLMLECWQHEPSKRPGFQYIWTKITDLLNHAGDH